MSRFVSSWHHLLVHLHILTVSSCVCFVCLTAPLLQPLLLDSSARIRTHVRLPTWTKDNSGSPGTLQVSSTRMDLLRNSVLCTEQFLEVSLSSVKTATGGLWRSYLVSQSNTPPFKCIHSIVSVPTENTDYFKCISLVSLTAENKTEQDPQLQCPESIYSPMGCS